MSKDQDWRGEHLLKISEKERNSNRGAARNIVGRANGKTVVSPATKAHHTQFIRSLSWGRK